MNKYSSLTLSELINSAQIDAQTDLERAFTTKLIAMFLSGELIELDEACELEQDNERLDEIARDLRGEKQILCKQIALMRLAIDTIGSEINHRAHLEAEAKHWESLSDELVEIIECVDLSNEHSEVAQS